MNLHLKNKVVLVTGGASGLGKSISTLLAEEGAKVAINYRSRRDEAERLAEQLSSLYGTGCLAVYADVANETDVHEMFDTIENKLGHIDASVNNAAYCANPACVDLDTNEFQKCVDVNLKGMFLVCRETVQRLKSRGSGGYIINVSSQAALRGSQSGKTAYDMAKAGMLGFTRSLAIETGELGINVNAVLPGLMYTDIIASKIDANPEAFNKRSLLRRIAKTEEIAQVVVFLCSDRASYMTGASVDVSGGMALH
ncbi:MAG: SDR family oxidoreductase [Planctomycetaceae bacterium]|jgi:3-oxoacyl-[acyl-carrier protein] reductase|nr:SDR family oxidoreductase [Planctomycetaceae bacterium]